MIRFGMVGGGEGAFIGAVHRHAAALAGGVQLVCGAFSRDAANCLRTGQALGLAADRCYTHYNDMFTLEADRPAAERMDFVVIVTPNNTHYEIAQAALASGYHVLSDKPATFSLSEALALHQQLRDVDLQYGITHTYAGYPMVMEAHRLVAAGALGTIRKVVVDYSQGWLASETASQDSKQAAWRLDPSQAGASCCIGDIGVHAAHLAECVSGQTITALCGELSSVYSDRVLDDDGMLLLKFDGGARGLLNASQISVGEENALTLRVYGEKGGLFWRQEEPNSLWLKWPDRPAELRRSGWDYQGDPASQHTRLPPGHPEGYLEAFANLYSAFRDQISAPEGAQQPHRFTCPGIGEAVRGMAFIESAVAASRSEHKWVSLPTLDV